MQGSIAASGTYNELQATGLDFAKLLEENGGAGGEDDDDDHADDPPIQKMLRQMSIAVSMQFIESVEKRPFYQLQFYNFKAS